MQCVLHSRARSFQDPHVCTPMNLQSSPAHVAASEASGKQFDVGCRRNPDGYCDQQVYMSNLDDVNNKKPSKRYLDKTEENSEGTEILDLYKKFYLRAESKRRQEATYAGGCSQWLHSSCGRS